jgi:hypothetical protein
MRFKEFLAERTESQGDFDTKKLSANEAVAWLEKRSHNYLDNVKRGRSHPIFRGMENDEKVVSYKDSNDFTRRSANTFNLYTQWMDNHASWKKFPKRSKSFICSTSFDTASGYGPQHLIIPADSARIGVCPAADLWESFKFHEDNESHLNLEEFMSDAMWALDLAGFDQQVEADWELLLDGLHATTLEKLNKSPKFVESKFAAEQLTFLLKEFGPTLYDVFEATFEPIVNGFSVKQASSFSAPDNREVWVQGEVIIINTFDVAHKINDDAAQLDTYLKTHGLDMTEIRK